MSQFSFLHVKRRWSEFVYLERLSVLGKEVSFSLFISLSLPGYVAERARSKYTRLELRLHSSYYPGNHSALLSASLDLSSQPAPFPN